MRRPRIASLGRAAVVVLVLATMIAAIQHTSTTRSALAADWQPTGLTEPANRLYAPASGAFCARTASALMRSDDGGATWHTVALPPELSDQGFKRSTVAVDPNDHTRLYVGNWASRDDGAAWTRLDDTATDIDSSITPVASGADPGLLYLGIVRGEQGTADLRLRRSNDGGVTWTTGLHLAYADFRPGAGVVITLFAAHPSDPNVAFQGIVGFRGNGNQTYLRRSDDQGKTWKETVFKVVHYPVQIVGGQGANPSRFYVAMSSEEEPSAVFKSDDGGVTWAETVALGEQPAHQEVYGLAYDPVSPDRVWVAPVKGGILASEDGGASWTAISPSEWEVRDLALGVDGANLYAATTQGVMRLPLR